MCFLCELKSPHSASAAESPPQVWSARRAFLLAGSAAAIGTGTDALAQVNVGQSSSLRKLVPAAELEAAAARQYSQMMEQARQQDALVPASDPQVRRLRQMAQRLIPHAAPWNGRARGWQWEVNLIASDQINAFCMPGGKIAFYTGILQTLRLDDDEAAMIMGHEMAHALREHARERLAKTQATGMGLSVLSSLLGLGQLGDVAASLGTQLLSLRFSREDETEADLVGLELAARSAYKPQASVSLWQKMAAQKGAGGLSFLSTHPSSPDRIRDLQSNVPKVQGLYEAARRG
ncbi:MAG: M48 family metallopeptidase [Hydrogenophaga sp.]